MIARRLGRALSAGCLTRRGELWSVDYRDAQGRRRRQALSTDRRVAERMRIEIIRQRDLEVAGLGTVEGQGRSLAELKDTYLEDLATRAVPKHVLNTRARLEAILDVLPAQRVCDLKPIEVIQHRARRLAEGISHRTANLQVDTLRSMLGWAVKVGLIAESPLRNMPRLKENEATKRYQRRALTEDEIEAFLAAAREDDRRNSVHRSRVPQEPFWRTLLETGARYGEVIRVSWADLDVGKRLLTLRAESTKTRKTRVIPLLEGLAEDLDGLRANHIAVLGRPLRPSDRVFLSPEGCAWPAHTVNVTRILHRLLEDAGIDRLDAHGKRVDVHALRHSFASRLARRGVPLAHAQRLLGHSTVEMTARVYTHLEVDDLRAAVRALGTTDAVARQLKNRAG
jgi:integrase